MNTEKKGIFAAISFILSIAVYYFLVQWIDWIWSDVCAKHYCMKTPSLAEFLAIEVAVIGVYFVVSSIDDWKKEAQYQTAKKNIKLLHGIFKKLEIYNVKLANLGDKKTGLIITIDTEKEDIIKHTYLFDIYKDKIYKLEIEKIIQEADFEITQQNRNLYQKEFDYLINLAHDYIVSIDIKIKNKEQDLIKQNDSEIKPISIEHEKNRKNAQNIEELFFLNVEYSKKISSLKKNLTQSDIDRIHKEEHSKFEDFEIKLNKLQTKLNEFVS